MMSLKENPTKGAVTLLMNIPRNSRTEKYDPDIYYRYTMGPGGVPFIDRMASHMNLKPGQRVLDLGCGMALSSVYLAKEFGVQVIAYDLWISATDNWRTIQRFGAEQLVIPVHGEAHQLPFAQESFDAIFSMDAYHYFGTSDLYLEYILQFLKKDGILAVGGPAIAEETYPEVPDVYRDWYDRSPDLYSIHSADWWRAHWSKGKLVDILHSETVPDGIDYWLETAEWTYKNGIEPPQGASAEDLDKYRSPEGGFMTLHILTARKKS